MRIRHVLSFIAVSGALLFAREDPVERRLRDAADVFREIMSTPDKSIPRALLGRSSCIVIVPGMKKAALGIGGEYGRGFASCRTPDGNWGAPAAIRLVGGSFGLQLGAQSTDVVLLVFNESGLKQMMSDKFTVGAQASAAAGPVGRSAEADTDILMRAEILSWSRSRGVFAGVSLNGTVVETDKRANEILYGSPFSNREIIEGKAPMPEVARILTSVLDEYARRA